jgi:hypothetical protein
MDSLLDRRILALGKGGQRPPIIPPLADLSRFRYNRDMSTDHPDSCLHPDTPRVEDLAGGGLLVCLPPPGVEADPGLSFSNHPLYVMYRRKCDLFTLERHIRSWFEKWPEMQSMDSYFREGDARVSVEIDPGFDGDADDRAYDIQTELEQKIERLHALRNTQHANSYWGIVFDSYGNGPLGRDQLGARLERAFDAQLGKGQWQVEFARTEKYRLERSVPDTIPGAPKSPRL